MGNLQVKDIPDDLHTELRRRAARRDMTIRDYVLELIRRDQATPSLEDWLDELARREPVKVDVDIPELIRQQREARTQEIIDRL